MSRSEFTLVGGVVVKGWAVACLTAVAVTGCEMAGSSGDAILGDLPGIAPEDSPGVAASEGSGDGDPVIAPGVQVDEQEALAIRDAAIAYVRQETAITDVTVEIDAVAEGWARLRVFPGGEETDPATLYMRREGSVWRGVAIGTGFIPPDLDEMEIPTGVRP